MKYRTSEGIRASSRTYRLATNKIAERLGKDPGHTTRPSADFERILKFVKRHPDIDVDELVRIARAYFRLGTRKGLREAAKAIDVGQIQVGRKYVTLTGAIKFTARVKMPDNRTQPIKISFDPYSLGFTE